MTEHYNSKILKYQLCFCLIPETQWTKQKRSFSLHMEIVYVKQNKEDFRLKISISKSCQYKSHWNQMESNDSSMLLNIWWKNVHSGIWISGSLEHWNTLSHLRTVTWYSKRAQGLSLGSRNGALGSVPLPRRHMLLTEPSLVRTGDSHPGHPISF